MNPEVCWLDTHVSQQASPSQSSYWEWVSDPIEREGKVKQREKEELGITLTKTQTLKNVWSLTPQLAPKNDKGWPLLLPWSGQ